MRELQRDKGMINPDLTPLIDVVFQLLIFFMLVTTFSQYTKFDMNLPQSNVETMDKPEVEVDLIIDKEAKLFLKIGDESIEIPRDQLVEKLKEFMEGRKEQVLVISADKDLKYETVIETMGQVKNAGIEKIEINTIK
ncbi:ExbD/TolR family protein [Fusobacterium sp.]|uniref:ExbD/TolR family protein n=1 Tax=Fusobacterium sp. TaxID=68766 RepID=UPI00396CA55B